MNKAYTHAVPRASILSPLLFRCLAAALLLCSSPFKGAAASPPNWSVNPSDYEYAMTMVMRVKYNGVPNNASGNMVGVFVGGELRGTGKTRVIGSDTYFFTTVYSNIFIGEKLRFRVYIAANDQIYATPDSLEFCHNKRIGSTSLPFWLNIDTNLDYPPEWSPFLADTTLQNIPFGPVSLTDHTVSLDNDPVGYSAAAGPNLSASINNGILTVTPNSPVWTGTELIRLIVRENTPSQLADTIWASFTVLPDPGPPVFSAIPTQTIFSGQTFNNFDLDQYLTFSGPCRRFDFDVFPFVGTVPSPAWVAPSPASPSMSLVVRPLFADEILGGANAKLAAFVGGALAGVANPVGIFPNIYYPLTLQNVGGGNLTFRFYHAENQYLYEKSTSISFNPGGTLGSVAAPYELQLSPLVPNLAPDGTVAVQIADASWVGNYPVDFIVWDCNEPLLRRDTVRALFRIVADTRPRIVSPYYVGVKEGTCSSALYDAQTLDPQYSEGAGLTYDIAGGADASKFSINAQTGVLSWNAFSPDFENPADANMDNRYQVLLRVTNSANAFDTLALTVEVLNLAVEPFLPRINGGAAVVCFNGSTVLTASGGESFVWNTGDISTSINAVTAGVYTVTVSNTAGCSGTASIRVAPQPSVVLKGFEKPICSGTQANFSSEATGGTTPYAFVWAGANGFSSGAQTPASFTVVAASAGTYTVTLTDGAGCSATTTATLSVSGNTAPSVIAANNGPLCVGATLNLSAVPSGGSGMYSQFNWSGPDAFNVANQNAALFAATLAAAGTYTVTVTDNAGCTATGTTVVQMKAVPSVAITNNSPLCEGNIIQLNAVPSGGSGVFSTFQWTGPSNYTSNEQNLVNLAAGPAFAGVFSVTLTDNAGCTATSNTTVSVLPRPVANIKTIAPACSATNMVLSAEVTGGGGTYVGFSWAGPNGYNASGQNPPAFPSMAGTYTVTVTDQNGCAGTTTTTATINPSPSIMATNNGPVCEGKNLLLASTPSGGTVPYMSFNWTGVDGYVAAVEDPASFSTTPASSGLYQVKVTDSKGCTATGTTTVLVSPKIVLSATSNSPACAGANIALNATASGGGGSLSYGWSGPLGFSSALEDPIITGVNAAKTGTYTVIATDVNGCSAATSTYVAVASIAAPTVAASAPGQICAGNTLALTSVPSGGSNVFSAYKWVGPNGFQASVQNPVPFMVNALASGTYSVTVTDNRGCNGTATATVVVHEPKATPSINAPICAGTTVLLRANPSDGAGNYAAFKWIGPNGYMSLDENPVGFPATMAIIGNYAVTVTDAAGCTGQGSVLVSFQANAPPSIACPGNQTVNTVSGCSGIVGTWIGTPTVMDDCTATANISVTQDPAANTPFSGQDAQRTVTLTADDQTGNTATCTFVITLKDNLPPSISCPANQTIAADDNCMGVIGDWRASASGLSDNCTLTANITLTQSIPFNTILNGNNAQQTVYLVANDGHGNTQSCSFNVTLRDVKPPSITCPGPLTVPLDNNCQVFVGDRTGLASNVLDNCTPFNAITVTQTPNATTVLNGHNTAQTVQLRATDASGNSSTCTFALTARDESQPTIACPTNIVRNTDQNVCNAVVTYSISGSDNCPGWSLALTGGQASSTAFQRGVTVVQWRNTDGAGLTANCSFTVTVVDNQAPNLECPGNLIRNTDPNQCSAFVSYNNPLATDNCEVASGGAIWVSGGIDHISGSGTSSAVFPKGTTTVEWKASDTAIPANTRTCTFTVTVLDTQKPNIACPANVVRANNPGVCGATVTYITPTATDNCTPAPTVVWVSGPSAAPNTNGANSTSFFPVGNNIIQWKSTDGSGNTRTCTFRVVISDSERPVITNCQTSVQRNTDPNQCNAVVIYSNPVFTDNCTPTNGTTVRVSGLPSGSMFPVGSNNVTFRATDASGNTTVCTMVVTITDNQPPSINCPGSLTVSGSGIPCVAQVNYGTPTTSDNCPGGLSPILTGGLASGSIFPLGITTNTWQVTAANGQTNTCSLTVTVTCTNLRPPLQNADADEHATAPTLALYLDPNPAASAVRIGFAGMGAEGGDLTIVDALGRILWRQDFETPRTQWILQDIGSWPKGLYLVLLRSGGKTTTKQLIVR